MHICHEEILGLISALPFLGLGATKLRRMWHRLRGYCIHEAWGEKSNVPGWSIEFSTRDNWFFGFRPFFYDAPYYCFGFGFFQLYYFGYPHFFGRTFDFEKAMKILEGIWVGPTRLRKLP